MKIVHLFGIAGVGSHESHEARLWAQRLEWPMMAVVLWIPLQWYLQETGAISLLAGRIADWVVWLAFIGETLLLTSLVRDRRGYLLTNWVNLVIIVGGIPLLWNLPYAALLRSMRLVLVVVLLARMSRSLRLLLGRHKLGPTLAVAFVTMVLSGLLIVRLDPSIGNVWDGMWWAWVTMATVGYGDVVPHNHAGRLFGAFLILFGVVLLSLLTANLAAFFIGSEVEKVEEEEREADRLLKDVAARLDRIERLLLEQRTKSTHEDNPGQP